MESDAFAKLPDNILLEILSYLPIKDLCISGRVCSRWRRIVRDNSLWRHVDLLPYRLNLAKMWKVLRAHFSECLLTFRLRGFLDPGGTKWKKHSLSDAMLGELRDRCPRIRSLHLEQCNTDNLNSDKLPTSLTHLTLRNCSWQPRWFKSRNLTLSNLKRLDLSHTTRVDNFDAEDISTFSNLEELKLNSCYRVSEAGIEKLTKLSRLRVLEISGTGCTDLALHHICRNLGHLQRLDISKCTKFTGSSIQNIGVSLKDLEYLNVSDCTQLNLVWLQCLSDCSKLSEIDVSGIGMSENDEKTLNKLIPCVTSIKKKLDIQNEHKSSMCIPDTGTDTELIQ